MLQRDAAHAAPGPAIGVRPQPLLEQGDGVAEAAQQDGAPDVAAAGGGVAAGRRGGAEPIGGRVVEQPDDERGPAGEQDVEVGHGVHVAEEERRVVAELGPHDRVQQPRVRDAHDRGGDGLDAGLAVPVAHAIEQPALALAHAVKGGDVARDGAEPERVAVHLQPAHGLGGVLVGARERLPDPRRAIGVEELAVEAQRVDRQGGVIGGPDAAARRVEQLGQIIRRDEAAGLRGRIPAAGRQPGRARRSLGHGARHLQADVALHVGVPDDQVELLERRDRGAELSMSPARGRSSSACTDVGASSTADRSASA